MEPPSRDDEATAPSGPTPASPFDGDADANLGDAEHAWWAQRDELVHGVPKGRRKRPEPEAPKDDPWSIDKLFDFTPDYDAPPETPPEHTTFDHDELFADPERARGLFRADDPYAVLGVPSSATWEEITEAHRRLARLHHPDRLANATEEARQRSEDRMRDVNIAYSELRRRRER